MKKKKLEKKFLKAYRIAKSEHRWANYYFGLWQACIQVAAKDNYPITVNQNGDPILKGYDKV